MDKKAYNKLVEEAMIEYRTKKYLNKPFTPLEILLTHLLLHPELMKPK